MAPLLPPRFSMGDMHTSLLNHEKEYMETQTPLMSLSNYGDPSHAPIPCSSSSSSPSSSSSADQRKIAQCNNTVPTPSGSSAQLTVFYGGMVNVYNNVSAETANEIISLALSNSCNENYHRATRELSSAMIPCQGMVPRALPLARKVSLARFLETRMIRIRSMAPYLVKNDGKTIPSDIGKEKVGSNYGSSSNCSHSSEMDYKNQRWVSMNEISECESAC